MITIITILKIMGLAWFITRFDPLQWVLDAIRFNFSDKRTYIHLSFNVIQTITTCTKCSAFWIGLCFGSIWIALIASFLSFWYDKLIGPIEYKITNPI